MKNLKIIPFLWAIICYACSVSAQNGPAGIGSTDGSSTLELWLRADQGISTIDGKVQTWSDLSGNGRDMSQSNSNYRPSFNTAQTELNEQPTVDFVSASSTFLEGATTQNLFGNSSNAPTNIGDIFVVFKQPLTNSGYVVQFPRTTGGGSFLTIVSNAGADTPADNNKLDDVQFFVRQDAPGWSVLSSEIANPNVFTVNNFHLARFGFNPTTEHIWLFNNNEEIESATLVNQISYQGNTGNEVSRLGSNGSSQFYDGEIAEMFVFSEEIDSAQYIIIQNYFNARYGLSTPNDHYAGDLDANQNHVEGVFGIGRHSASELVTTANNQGLQLEANTGLDDGDYLFAGHRINNNALIDNDINGITGTAPARMKRMWYLDQTDAATSLTTNITFDLDEAGFQEVILSTASNYKLIRRSSSSNGTWTVEAIVPTINDTENTISFSNISIADGEFYTLATTDNTVSPLGDIQQTWYSFQSGSWGNPTTWTLDGATTPILDNDDNEIPGSGDLVVITSGRTLNMYQSDGSTILDNVTVQDLTIRSSGRLNILTSTGHDMGFISGSGVMAIQGYSNTGSTAYIENLPDGDYSEFADQLLGGTITLNTATNDIPLVLNQDLSSGVTTDPNGAVSRNLTINMGDSDDLVILQRDLYLTRNLNITQGQMQVHRNSGETYNDITFSDTDLTLEVVNNVTVSAIASLTTGTANQRHQFNSYGDFTINGTASFTQRSSANLTTDATDGVIDLNFLNTAADQVLNCNAQGNFYRIKIDKQSSAYTLSIIANADGNFNLYGRADYSIDSDLSYGGTNQNAFALVTGTAQLGNNVNFTLNQGGNYSISSNAQLWVDGGEIIKSNGSALVPYGTFKISSGTAEFLVPSGITIRDAGVIEVSGGSLYANQIRTSIQATDDIGSYIQTGGHVYVNGGSGTGPSGTFSTGTQQDYFVFCLPEEENVFRMSGGTLEIQRSNYNTTSSSGTPNDNDATDDLGGGIFINSDPQNIEVTGGTVIMNMDNTVPFKITSKAPFFDVIMTNSGGAAISDGDGQTTVNIQTTDDNIIFLAGGQSGDGSGADKVMTAQPLVVLNDLTIGDGMNPVRFDHLGQDVTIGRHFTIEPNGQYYFGDEDLLPSNAAGTVGLSNSNSTPIPSSHENTTIFNGSINSIIALDNLDVLTADRPTGHNETENNEQVFFNITISKTNDATLTLVANNKPVGGGASNVHNALRTGDNSAFRLESGTFDQGDRSVRFYGGVYNASQLGVYEEGVTDLGALLKFRPVTFTIETEPGAVFGNFRLNCQNQIVSLDNEVTIERLEYFHGRLYIGSNNLIIEELDIHLSASQADYSNCDGCFSVEDMIVTDGNASDGGLTLRITTASNPSANGDTNFNGNTTINNINEADFLFPIGVGTSGLHNGTSKYTPAILSISNVGDVGSDGEAFITVNPVNSELQTTDLSSGEALTYYWRVRTEGFDTQPTLDLLKFFGNDVDVPTPANLTSYVSGKVEDSGAYTRSSESPTVSDPANPSFEVTDYSILFDGDGGGLTLEDHNFTAGDASRFSGSPRRIYARKNGQWHDPSTWSENANGSPALTLVSELPQPGDIVILGSNAGGANRLVAVDPGNANFATIDIAQLVLLRYHTGESSLVTFGDSEAQRALHNFGIVTNHDPDLADPTSTSTHSSKLKFAGPGLPLGDFGEFTSAPNTIWTYARQFPGTTVNISDMAGGNVANTTFDGFTIDNAVTEYPNLQFDASGSTIGGSNRYIILPDVDIVVNGDIRNFIGSNSVKLNTSATGGDVYVNGNVAFNGGTNVIEFQATGSPRTLTVEGDIDFRNNASSNELRVENAASSLEHNILLHGNVINNSNNSVINLFNSDANTKGSITFIGNEDSSIPDFNTDITLNKLIINKEDDQTYSVTVQDDITFPDITISNDHPIDLVNGVLILDNSGIDLTLANASTDDFSIPDFGYSDASSGSAGLEIQQGTIRIEGDDTGLILDGSLILSGGNLDMSSGAGNGNNFIEYSATGYASIEVNNATSTLSVGSQIRRSFFSESGILDYTQTDGTVEIGASANGDYRRGMLEIVNTGSNFIHTGGTLRFLNQNGATATDALKASLLLEPETYDLTGSTIEIDLNETDDDNFSINSAIAINNLSLASTTGIESEVVSLKTRDLTITGDLTITDDIEFRSNNLNLTLNGNMTIDNNATYSPGINTTTFTIANGVTAFLNGSNSDIVEFYNFEKSDEGTLSLSKDIEITGATFELLEGTLADNDNLIDFVGQSMTNNGTHTSGSNLEKAGIRFKRTSGEQILSTAAEGIFGNLTINNSDGVSLPDANQEFQINNNLTLEQGILDIGPALLLFTSTGSITNADGLGSELTHFGEENQIQTNSSIIDFGMEKEFAANENTDFVFPVGEGNRYTPVKVDFTSGNSGSTVGRLRIRPRNAVAPIMLSEDQSTQDAILQYHWLINGTGFTAFGADLIASYDDDVIGTDAESTYRGARAIFSDPNLAVENPFPSAGDFVDDANNTITYPIALESDFSGEYFAGDPLSIPDSFTTLVFDAFDNNNYDHPNNYFYDADDSGDLNGGESRETNLNSVTGGAIEIASAVTMSLNINNVSFSRLIIPSDGTLEIDGTNGHILGQVSGTGTIRINSDNNSAALPAGDYLNFFDCSGGALEYGGDGDYTIMVESNEVRQLTLNGSGNKSFVSNSDIDVCENLIINAGTLNLADERQLTVGNDLTLNDGAFNMATDGVIRIEGNTSLLGGTYTAADNSDVEMLGDLTKTGTTIVSSAGSPGQISFIGSSTQNITGDMTFENVVINNTAASPAINLTGGTELEISNNIQLLDGVIATDNTLFKSGLFTISNILVFGNSATFSGGSSESFVDGVVRKDNLPANSIFTLPIGNGTTYAPITIEEDGTGGINWTARYRRTNPSSYLSNNYDNIGTTTVSNHEFWVVYPSSPNQTANIGLTYGPQSNVLTPNETTVVQIEDTIGGGDGVDNSDPWADAGRKGLSSGASTTAGTITTNPTTISLGFFSLGGQSDTALPVELLDFKAKLENDVVEVNWITSSELNNDYFEIERSQDGVNYEVIGKIAGNGTINETSYYNFTDYRPATGVSYYRLTQFDYDGTKAVFEAISIENNPIEQGLEVHIFPNPTMSDNINLRITNDSERESIKVLLHDVSGNLLYQDVISIDTGFFDYEFSLPTELEKGIYLITILGQQNQQTQRLIIK
ncbi:T9SS type A sorting domain-containing protein [Reichenbachiella sp.]|uniref:T9SS type A sorting domain-containing protein n=1 Tax=Reichenbachiella sp. TaxID=2184521 RepID=UPI003B5CA7F1